MYGSWFPWSQCEYETKIKRDGSRFCYEGGKIRERYVTKITEAEGNDCDKDFMDYSDCTLEAEPFPDKCKLIQIIDEKVDNHLKNFHSQILTNTVVFLFRQK